MYYSLEKDGTVTKCDSIPTTNNKSIKFTQFDGVSVSTVFLFMDHSFRGGTPILFETMVFGGEYDQHIDRYHTLYEAKEGHEKICEMVNPIPKRRESKINSILEN